MTTTVLAYIPSPSQGVWHIGPLPLRAYALFIIVGIVAALVIGDRRWEARGGERGVIYDIALWAVPFGLIGGRLYHVITDWRTYFAEGGAGVAGALRIWDGGLGIWGAVALGGVGAWIACRRRGIPLPAFGDAIAPGIVLAQAIGRLGNYFNQELYGRQTTLPWGLEIYQRQDASGAVSPHLVNGVSTGQLDSVVHPTFLYELLWNLLVFAVLIYVDRRFRIGHGRLFALYVAGYCLVRYWIDLMRSDAATHIAGIRINSFTAGFVFIGAVVYIMAAPKGREDPATLKGKPREGDESFVGDELAAVAATAPVLAAAKVASESDEDDAKTVAAADEDRKAEIADEAEELGADVAGVPADDVAQAEEFAATGEDEHESEAAMEAETLAADVEDAPAEEIAKAEEFAAAGEGAGDDVGGLGAVEGEDAVAAEESADEAHEAAVEGAAEAEEVAAEAKGDAAADEAEAPADEAPESEVAADESAAGEATEGEPSEAEPGDDVGGVGAVEGEDAVAAEQSADEAHEAAVEGAVEAEETAGEAEAVAGDAEAPADEAPVAEPSDAESDAVDDVGGVGAVEGEDAIAAEESADEAHEAADEARGTDEAAEPSDAESDAVDDVGGVGAVEGEDAIAAEESADQVHEAAVEGAAEAEEVAAEAEVAADKAPETDEAAKPEAAVEAETLAEQVDEAPAEEIAEAEEFAAAGEEAGTDTGGVGAVEGEDAIEAEQAAQEAHEAAVEGAKEAEQVTDETSGGRLRRWIRNRRSR